MSVCGVRCSGLTGHARGVGSENGDSGRIASPPLWSSGGSELAERQWGVVARRQLAALGVVAPHRGSLAARGPAAPRAPRRLRPRAHRAARRGTPLGGGARLRARCGALSHRSAAAHWGLLRTDQTRIDVTAASRPPRRPGDPPAPLSLPRCPGHHPPRRHPDHDGPPHAARSRRHRAPQRARARARPSRAPPPLRPPRHPGRHRQKPTGTAEHRVLARAASRKPKWTQNEWEADFLKLLREAGLPEPETNEPFHVARPRPLRTRLPLARSTASSSRLDGFETHGTRQASETTAPRTPPSPPPATASSDSPATTSPPSRSSAYAQLLARRSGA